MSTNTESSNEATDQCKSLLSLLATVWTNIENYERDVEKYEQFKTKEPQLAAEYLNVLKLYDLFKVASTVAPENDKGTVMKFSETVLDAAKAITKNSENGLSQLSKEDAVRTLHGLYSLSLSGSKPGYVSSFAATDGSFTNFAQNRWSKDQAKFQKRIDDLQSRDWVSNLSKWSTDFNDALASASLVATAVKERPAVSNRYIALSLDHLKYNGGESV